MNELSGMNATLFGVSNRIVLDTHWDLFFIEGVGLFTAQGLGEDIGEELLRGFDPRPTGYMWLQR